MKNAPAGRPPARADHIGSLLRPAELRRAFRDFNEGAIGEAEFRTIQDEAIRGVVKLQHDVGLEIINDGEFRRGSYWSRFVQRTPTGARERRNRTLRPTPSADDEFGRHAPGAVRVVSCRLSH